MSSSPLRPLSISDLLDATFRLYRAHFLLFCRITAILLVPLTIIGIFTKLLPVADSILGLCQSLVVNNLLTAALVYVAGQLYFQQMPSTKTAYQTGWQKCVRVWGAMFLQGLALIVPIIAVAAVIFLATVAGISAVLVGTVGGVVMLCVILFFTMRWYVAVPIIVLEGLGAVDGLQRSWNLTKSRKWHVLATSLSLGTIAFIFTTMPTLFVNYGSSILGTFGVELSVSAQVAYVITQLGLILTLPLTAIGQTLVYYDLRVRAEAYDLEIVAAAPSPTLIQESA